MAVDSWYAVQTKPRREDQVLAWLAQRAGVPVFFPKLESLRRRRGQKVHHIEPLFPSYLFVRMSLEAEDWNKVRWTPGVRRIVGTGEVPVAVPDQAIDILKARCQRDDVIAWEPTLSPGTTVRIKDGPFSGFVGVLERPASRAQRVRVLLTLLQTVASIEVDIVDLEEVSG